MGHKQTGPCDRFNTIIEHLRHFRALLDWARRQIHSSPVFRVGRMAILAFAQHQRSRRSLWLIWAMKRTSLLYSSVQRLSLHMHALTAMERRHRKVSVVQCFGLLTLSHARRKKRLLQVLSHSSAANGLQKVCADRDGRLRGRPFACLAAWLCISTISGSQPITNRRKHSGSIISAWYWHV